MSRTAIYLAALATASLAGPAFAADPSMSLDDVIAKHVEAHGGKASWAEVRSLKMTGTMTSWSKKAPFTLVKTRDGKYRLDGVQDEQKLEIGYDGTTAWWDNRMMQEGAQKVRGADLAVILRDTDFPTPFFDYKEKKYDVQLLGPKEIEGRDALALGVKRADGLEETWYLDPATYLEIARESPGSDFGRPVPQQTFYEDFRKVGGITMPFRIDSNWYTRERALEIASIETNVAVDDASFRLPPPIGMGPLQSLAGNWKVTFSRRSQDGAPWTDGERESTIDASLGGAMMQERYKSTEGSEVMRSFTYDRYRKRYRITDINEQQTYLDILDGDFDESKRLVLSDIDTGTPALMFGLTIHSRLALFEIGPDGFKVEEDYSIDGGKNWVNVLKATYTRK